MKATELPSLKRAASSALPLDFEEHIFKEGQRSSLKKIIGPAAIANMQTHKSTKMDNQITYPLYSKVRKR
jgi:hypothetical protein